MFSVKAGMVVGINYTLKNEAGEVLDKSLPNEPLYYLHGVGQVIPGMEKGLEGKKVGEHVSLTIGPEEGYGHINPQLLGEVPKTMFEGGVPEVGMQFQAQMGEQVQIITVKEIKGDSVVIDGNHALAGQTLHFSIGIAAVRPATDEEKAHGHAHGPDGTDTH